MDDKRTREAVAWVAKTLGLTADEIRNHIDSRLKIQKTVYLLSYVGVDDLKFSFSLYIRGPYSPVLTSIYYKLVEEGDTAIAKQAKKASKRMKPYIGLARWFGRRTPSELEISSSILAFHENAKLLGESLNKERTLSLVRARKSWVTSQSFDKSYGELEEKGLLAGKA
jgi:uncharacterized protein YwgA